jgi:hypothetical protein
MGNLLMLRTAMTVLQLRCDTGVLDVYDGLIK